MRTGGSMLPLPFLNVTAVNDLPSKMTLSVVVVTIPFACVA
jgi:hypothetical protein